MSEKLGQTVIIGRRRFERNSGDNGYCELVRDGIRGIDTKQGQFSEAELLELKKSSEARREFKKNSPYGVR